MHDGASDLRVYAFEAQGIAFLGKGQRPQWSPGGAYLFVMASPSQDAAVVEASVLPGVAPTAPIKIGRVRDARWLGSPSAQMRLAAAVAYLFMAAVLVLCGPYLLKVFGSGKQMLPPVFLGLMSLDAFLLMQFSFWGTLIATQNRLPYLWPTVATNVLSFLLSLNLVAFTSLGLGALVLGPLLGCAADDDMVQDLDFQQLPGANQVTRHFDVGFGRRRVAAGMVVHQYDRGGVGLDGGPEHLARMHQDGVERAVRNFHWCSDQPAAGVQQENLEPSLR